VSMLEMLEIMNNCHVWIWIRIESGFMILWIRMQRQENEEKMYMVNYWSFA
jgi:hypothetical protein